MRTIVALLSVLVSCVTFAVEPNSIGDLSVTVFVSPDDRFVEEWFTTSEKHAPTIRRITEARANQLVYVGFIITGYASDKTGASSVEVDVRVNYPNGDVLFTQEQFARYRGTESVEAFALADPVLQLMVEPSDPMGKYKIQAIVHDRVTGKSSSGEVSLTITTIAIPGSASPHARNNEMFGWADVQIESTGVVGQVEIVSPSLSSELALPIENAIRQWIFKPANIAGNDVPRTTSIMFMIGILSEPNAASRLEIKNVAEGPRIVKRSRHRCLSEVTLGSPYLTFTVTADGKAVDVTVSGLEGDAERCALKVTRETMFKPETVDGHPVSSKVSKQMQYK